MGRRGQKICPSCSQTTGPRSFKCPNCNYNFQFKIKTKKKTKTQIETKPKIIKTFNKIGQGKKQCSCGTIIGVRTRVCSSCNKSFIFTPKCLKEKRKKINWRELQKQDYFRVMVGSGPYYPVDKETGIERINMGYSGIFRVAYLEDNGIHAYPITKGESGHCFIYMGPKEKAKNGLVRRPHKIVKVKPRIR